MSNATALDEVQRALVFVQNFPTLAEYKGLKKEDSLIKEDECLVVPKRFVYEMMRLLKTGQPMEHVEIRDFESKWYVENKWLGD